MPDSALKGAPTFYRGRTRRRGIRYQLDRMLLPNSGWAEGWRSCSRNTGERVESSCSSPWLSARARRGRRQPRQETGMVVTADDWLLQVFRSTSFSRLTHYLADVGSVVSSTE